MTETNLPSVAPRYSHWPKTALRVGFGTIWLIDAVLKWLPGFRRNYMDTIMGQTDGQPGWTKPWFDFWTTIQHPYATFFAYLVAVLETLIAVALIAGFARKITYLAAIALSLLIWGTAEGFGGPYTSGASDIGTAVIYALVFSALLAFGYYQGPAPYSADIWLEQRISWWHWIAETGAQNHHPQTSVPRIPAAPAVPTAATIPTSAPPALAGSPKVRTTTG
jgi:nitrite reductase (NO-forming)